MNTLYPRKMLVSAVALALVLSGCLMIGASQGSTARASTDALHSDHSNSNQAVKLQEMKKRWRKQADELRKGLFPIIDEAAALIGVDAQQVRQQLSQGKSLADVASEKGLSEAALTEKLLKVRTAKLEEAVKSGKLTKERADAIKTKMQSHIGYMVRKKGLEDPEPGHKGMRHTMRGLHLLGPEKLAALLGMTTEQLIQELKSGKSVTEVAESKGIKKEDLIEKIKEEWTPALEMALDRKPFFEKHEKPGGNTGKQDGNAKKSS